MKICNYCRSENHDEARECLGCGTDLSITPDPPATVLQVEAFAAPESPRQTIDLELPVEISMTEWPETEPDVLPGEESMLCTNCAFPNFPEARWCKRCGAPLGWAAQLVFPEAAIAVGYGFRNAVNQPNRTALFCIWILCSFGIVTNFLVLLLLFTGRLPNIGNELMVEIAWLDLLFKERFRDINNLYIFWRVLLSLTIAISLLFRTTRNYLAISRRMLEEEEP